MTYANGGNITIINGYRIHTFVTSGTLTVLDSGLVDVLVVGGGGNGGNGNQNVNGGGGGGGKVIIQENFSITSGNIFVTVGSAENASQFATLIASPGNRGSAGYGGQSGNNYPGGNPAGAGAGGGGGASQAGTVAGGDNNGPVYGKGGDGITCDYSGANAAYGGGGGGGAWSSGGYGGTGGGGNGGRGATPIINGTSGLPNTGGGGGGGDTTINIATGSGASGIVIVRYKLLSLAQQPVILTGS
jgi:hypothetical protein